MNDAKYHGGGSRFRRQAGDRSHCRDESGDHAPVSPRRARQFVRDLEEGTWAVWLHDLLKPHVTRVVVCVEALGVVIGSQSFYPFAIGRLFLTGEKLCSQKHNAKSGNCRDISNLFIGLVQSRACVNAPTAKLEDTG